MPSTTHSKGAQSSLDGRLTRAEPELTPSVRTKISMLPNLRRQQVLEQQNSSIELQEQHDDRAETVTESFNQLAELSQAASDTQKPVKPTASTRYTISSRISAPMAATSSPQANDTPKMPEDTPPAINHHRKPSYVVNVTNFDVHRGETAVTKAPVVGDDILSRLESLRQFKEWGVRIHDGAHQQADLVSTAGSQHTSASIDNPHPIERRDERVSMKVYSARIEHDLPLRHDSELLERNIDAPTPFSSPRVTPVPSTTTHVQRSRQPSIALPEIDLSGSLSRDTMAHIGLTSHSKTVVISSESPSLQLVPGSGSASRTRSDTQVPQRANSKSRSHPPISFPKDFYERFPYVEEISAHTREQQSQGRAKPSSGVSPKTIPTKPHEDRTVPEDMESPATPHDKRGRPTFYTTIHYFTDCSHASPPANRPLDPNSQPRPDPDSHLSHSTNIRSIIPGACFTCDVAHRRNREEGIISTNTAQIAQLTNKLAGALEELELNESEDEEAACLHDRFSARLLTRSTFAEDKHDLDFETKGARELPPLSDDLEIANALHTGKLRTVEQRSYLERAAEEIRGLEVRIDQVREKQDEQIRKIWAGFTPRWGPATLGVQRGCQGTRVTRAPSADCEPVSSQHHGSTTTDDADEIQVFTAAVGDQDLGVNVSSIDGSNVSNCTSRDRSRSSRSRSGTRTPLTTSSVSARDITGSRTPGEGKMRVGWIREEKDQD